MLSERDAFMWQEHYKELLREADKERLIGQALGQIKRPGFQERALVWLGNHFVAWGCYLQRRYALGVVHNPRIDSFDPARVTSDCG